MPLPSGFIEIDEKFVIKTFEVRNLDPDTDYNMYITAGSAHPGYTDLIDADSTVFLEFVTLKAPIVYKLNLEWSGVRGIGIGIFVIGLVWLLGYQN